MTEDDFVLMILCLVTSAFGITRFLVPVSGKINRADIYKDMAHLWVGFLFGWAAAGNWQGWWLAGGLTVLEVVAFVVRKK